MTETRTPTPLEEMFPSGWAMASFALREKLARPALAGWVLVAAPGRPVHRAWVGLNAYDRAAQAGMLQSAMTRMREPVQVYLAAACGPNAVLQLARREIARWMTPAVGHDAVAFALVRRWFGARIRVKELAERTGVHRNTIGRAYGTVRERLVVLHDATARDLDQLYAGESQTSAGGG